MNNNIQNIFIDLKSYELIQNSITRDELVEYIHANVNTENIKPISICGHLFEVEYHPKNDYLGFTYTIPAFHDICHKESRFKNSIYIYSSSAMKQYDEGFSGITLLLFTTKGSLYVIPYGESEMRKMECKSG